MQKLSQRPKEFKLVVFYFYFIGITSLLLLTFVVVAHTSKDVYKIVAWTRIVLYLFGRFLGNFVWLINIMNRMTDAYGLTVSAEIRQRFSKNY